MEFSKKNFLKTVRFENFKSYIGENEVGPCHPTLNSIIGPNGCGKSNFFDAILFVLGKRAVEIRFKFLSDIISFSRFKKYKLTSITISFRSDSLSLGGKVKGFSETFITRKVLKTNFSIYFVNGREIGFQTLAKIFLEKGIFLKNNRFLVQQGEIEKISTMKPMGKNAEETGILEFSEEIFGSFRYIKLLNRLKKENERITKEKSFKNQNLKKNEQFFEKKKNIFFGKLKILTRIHYLFHILAAQITSRESFFYKNKQHQQNFLELNRGLFFLSEKIQKIDYMGFENTKVSIGGVFLTKTEILRKLQKNKGKKILSKKSNFSNLKLIELNKISEEEKKKRIVSINEKMIKSFLFDQTRDPFFSKNLSYSHKESNLLFFFYFWKTWTQKLGLFIKNSGEFFQKNDQTFISKRKSFFFSISFLDKEKHSFFIGKKKVSNNFSRGHFHYQYKKFLVESKNVFRSMFTFSRIKSVKEKYISEKKFDSTVFQDPLEKFFTHNKNSRGLYGQLGSLGYVNLKLFLPIISVLKSELESFVVGTISESIPLAESFNKKKFGRIKILILEKIKFLSFTQKKFLISKKLIDKIFTAEKFKPIFNLFVNETLIVENLSQGIHHVFDSDVRKRVVTINGEMIEESGIFSGGGDFNQNYSFLKKTETNLFKWVKVFKFLYIQKKILENFKVNNLKEIYNYLHQLSNFGGTEELWIFSSLDRINRKEIFDYLKWNIHFSSNYLLFQTFLSFILGKTLRISKFKKKNKLSFFFLIKKGYKLELKISSGLTIFEFFRKNLFFKKSPRISNQQKNQETQYSLTFLRSIFRQILSGRVKNSSRKNQKILYFFQNFSAAFNWWIRNFSLLLNYVLLKKKLSCVVLEKFTRSKTQLTKKICSCIQKINSSRKKLKNLISKKNRIKSEIKKIFFFSQKFQDFQNSIDFSKILNAFNFNFQDLHWEKFVGFTNKGIPDTLEGKNFIIGLKSKRKSLFPVENFLHTVLKKLEFIKLKGIQNYVKKKIKSKKDLNSRVAEQVHSQRLTDFLQNFFLFERKSNLIYSLIAGGGAVEIEIINENDPFSQGILLSIRPPNKTWKLISQLSGGEKTIGSLAMIFSFQALKPVLWYLFDEIDAALDFKNVSKISSHIVSCSRESQILIVSLRTNMFDKAEHTFGIGKINDETKIIILRKPKMIF